MIKDELDQNADLEIIMLSKKYTKAKFGRV